MLIIFDFDSTVVRAESLDEVLALALANDANAASKKQKIHELTAAGMEGEISFAKSLQSRLQIATPSQRDFEKVGELMLPKITSGFGNLFENLRKRRLEIFIVSGGFVPCILPVAKFLGISRKNIWANVPLFDSEKKFAGIDDQNHFPILGDKTPVIQKIKSENFGKKIILVGDGNNDLQAFESGAADAFIGFGANAVREKVRKKAPFWAENTAQVLETVEKICRNFGHHL